MKTLTLVSSVLALIALELTADDDRMYHRGMGTYAYGDNVLGSHQR